jgi:hypothetical protein
VNMTLERVDLRTREIYLRRLERLARLRYYEQNGNGGDLNALGMRMVDYAINATISDCTWQGAAGTAQNIVERWRLNP